MILVLQAFAGESPDGSLAQPHLVKPDGWDARPQTETTPRGALLQNQSLAGIRCIRTCCNAAASRTTRSGVEYNLLSHMHMRQKVVMA
jgi:hypothetical protein